MEATREKASELRRRYQREWRRKNKEKVAEYNRNYWMKKAKELEWVNHDAKKQHKKSPKLNYPRQSVFEKMGHVFFDIILYYHM